MRSELVPLLFIFIMKEATRECKVWNLWDTGTLVLTSLEDVEAGFGVERTEVKF